MNMENYHSKNSFILCSEFDSGEKVEEEYNDCTYSEAWNMHADNMQTIMNSHECNSIETKTQVEIKK